MTSKSRQSEALTEYDMSEFSSWMNVIIDPTSRHSKHCAYMEVVALLHAGQSSFHSDELEAAV